MTDTDGILRRGRPSQHESSPACCEEAHILPHLPAVIDFPESCSFIAIGNRLLQCVIKFILDLSICDMQGGPA